MKRFAVTSTIDADCIGNGAFIAGELYHVSHNTSGGGVWTPVARYFGWHPEFIEGFNPHWRVDCFFRKHPLSPAPMPTGEALIAALVREGRCAEPMWLSVHSSEELEGKAHGAVFEED